MMTIKTENWLGEFVSTIGTGDAILGGAIDGFAGFSNVGDDVDVYYTIIDGLDKETGIGTLTGGKLVRKDIHATLVDGAYVKNGSAINLSGAAQVYGTANAHFLDYVQAVVNAEIVNAQAIAELKALQINGHALTASFNLTAADVRAHPDSWMPSTEALNVYQKDASDIRYIKTQDAEQVAGLVMRVGGARDQQLQQSINEALRRSYAEAGYNLVDGSFETGGALVNANDVLLHEASGNAFSGPAGTVAAGTNPAGGGFVDRSAETLRHKLALNTGAGMVATADGRSVQARFDNIPAEIDAAGTAAAFISQHNSSSAAHPELSAFISAEANRAEAAAESVKPYVDSALSNLSTAANKFYPTLALANADIANITVNQPVTVGEAVNGGLWYKATAGATSLTKSPYDPVRLMIEQLDERVGIENEDDVELLVDRDGQIIRRQTPSGDMYLVGLEGSIQKNFQDVHDRQKYDSEEPVFRLLDANDSVVFSILANGDVVTTSGNLNQLVENLFTKLSDSSSYELSAYIDASLDVLPANYSVDASSLVLKSAAVSNNYIKLDTPYRNDDGVVHPCVIQLNKPILGFKYWMCITPYGNMQILEENPCIYGSNDLDSWTLIKGIEQPLDNPPDWDEKGTGEKGFLSDCFWIYDHKTCELYCCYRKCYTYGLSKYNDTDIYQLLYRKTRNGLNWSEPEQMFPDTLAGTDEIASPSIVWDETTQKWVMYAFDDGNRLYMRTNDDFRNKDGWSARIEIGFQAFASANNLGGWHLEVRWVGDRLFMLINDYRKNGTLYFAYADKTDLSRWTFSNTKLVTGNPSGCYKASFITEESGTSVNIHVFWTDSSNSRKLRKFTITEGKI